MGMDASALIGLFIAPTVTAALVSSGVAFIVSRRTNDLAEAKLNSEEALGKARLAQEKAVGDQRLDQEQRLALQRINAEVALAEKTADLERQSTIAETRRVFAEGVLADFYQAQHILIQARMSWLRRIGDSSRKKGPDETEEQTRDLDDIYAPFEQLSRQTMFFSELQSKKSRLMALLGGQAGDPFDKIDSLFYRIAKATDELVRNNGKLSLEEFDRRRLILGINSGDEEDPLAPEIDQAVAAIEALCRPLIERAS